MMKVTLPNGTVIEDISTQEELSWCLAGVEKPLPAEWIKQWNAIWTNAGFPMLCISDG